jgi:transcriptional regulator with XRE-family HTH domain
MRNRAIRLRGNGWSYADITRRLGVSKSTLSGWLKSVPYEPNDRVRLRIKNGPAKSNMVQSQARLKSIAETKELASKEIGKLSKRDIFILGIAIYMGEGSKTYETVRIVNADPEIIKIAIVWFTECCKIPRDNMRIRIHMYPDTSERQSIRYWSKITGLSKKQFGKTVVDTRSNKSSIKKRKLPYGTAHLSILSMGDRQKGVVLHRRITGWIEAVNRQNAGIV